MLVNNAKKFRYFMLARNASKFSDFKKAQLGAVIVYKGKILSVGYNTNKESPLQKSYNRYRGFDTDSCKNTNHAEMMAIKNVLGLDINWSKAAIFVYREKKNGELGLARPCKACMKALEDLGIRDVYYTKNGGFSYERR